MPAGSSPSATAVAEAEQVRRSVLTFMRVAVWTWPAFHALDVFMLLALYPEAPYWPFLVLRAVGEVLVLGGLWVARRPVASARSCMAACSAVFISLSLGISLMTLYLGGLNSSYMHGLSIMLLFGATLVPAPWTAVVLRSTCMVLTFPAVNLTAALWSGLPLVPLREQLLLFIANFVFVVGSMVLGAVGSHMLWAARRQVHRAHREIREARRLGQYTLEEKLGEGGMGVVYRASHAMLRRPTAVKLLAPEKAGNETIARFEREVRLTARLTHPNTITIFDYGRTPEGIFYYAMELLEGANLEEVVEVSGAMPAARVIHAASQIAGALIEAHATGLIHRDIKPANIILCERGLVPDVVKVVDFGLVRELDGGSAALSRAGSVAGTPLYLAPEAMCAPDEVDARADLYALGCVIYYLLAGEHVFRGSTTMEVCGHHLHSAPTPIGERARVALPAELGAVVMACLQKNPAERPASAADLLDRLRACASEGWTVDQARGWWTENGAKLRAHHQAQTKSAASTIAIDLNRR